MKIKIKKNNEACSVSDIKQLEEFLGYGLPCDYKNFLTQYNGGRPNANIFPILEKRNESGVNKFLSQKEIIKEKKILGHRLVNGVIPIADAACGDVVCLSLYPGKEGIYFWDHELEDEERNLPSWKNMFYLAESFDAFLDSLKKFDLSKIELKPGQVQEVWVDPEFFKQLNNDSDK